MRRTDIGERLDIPFGEELAVAKLDRVLQLLRETPQETMELEGETVGSSELSGRLERELKDEYGGLEPRPSTQRPMTSRCA